MQITYHDDKKQKYQSVTASVRVELPHYQELSHEGYGETEEEARTNLLTELAEILDAIDVNFKDVPRATTSPGGNPDTECKEVNNGRI